MPTNQAAVLPDLKSVSVHLTATGLDSAAPTGTATTTRAIDSGFVLEQPNLCGNAPPTGCPVTWGSWTSPGTFKIATSGDYGVANLNLWLTASKPVVLVQFDAALKKIDAGKTTGTDIYTWQYRSSSLADSFVNGATGLPPLVLTDTDSVNIGLKTTIADNKKATILPGDKLELRFNAFQSTALAPAPAEIRILTQFGSVTKDSAITLPVLAADSPYSTGDMLGLFLEDNNALGFAFPPSGGAVKLREIDYSESNTPRAQIIGQVAADATYQVNGNSHARLYFQMQPTQASPAPGLAARLTVELALVTGSGADAKTYAAPRMNVAAQTAATASGFSFVLPTSGASIPAGTLLKLQLKVIGVNVTEVAKVFIAYGDGKNTGVPSGVEIPTISSGGGGPAPTTSASSPATSGTTSATTTPSSTAATSSNGQNSGSGEAGVSNGDFSLYSDRTTARARAGASASYLLTLENRGSAASAWELSASGVPSVDAATFVPASGNVSGKAKATAVLSVAAGETAPIGSFDFTISAKFGTTTVGPLRLTFVVEAKPNGPGTPAPQPSLPGATGPVLNPVVTGTEDVGGALQADNNVYDLSGEQRKATPGFEAALVVAALGACIVLLRRRA